MISGPLVRYILTAARRDKLAITFLLMIVLGGALSVLLGGASSVEPEGFSLVFGAGGLRILGATGIVLFSAFYMRRSFDSKEVEFLLSRPISRMTFLISHALSFILVAFIAAVFVSLPVLMLGKPNLSGLLVWGYSIAIEYAVMAVMAFFFSMVLTSAAGSALAALGFYVLSRLIGTLLGIAYMAPDNVILGILGKVMRVISVVIPRLDLMGQTSWLVYGYEGAGTLSKNVPVWGQQLFETVGMTGFIGLQGLFFLGLVLAATAYDFNRRQF